MICRLKEQDASKGKDTPSKIHPHAMEAILFLSTDLVAEVVDEIFLQRERRNSSLVSQIASPENEKSANWLTTPLEQHEAQTVLNKLSSKFSEKSQTVVLI